MTPIDRLPPLDWSDIAREQIALEPDADALVQRSTVAVRIRDVLSAGLVYENLVSPPWFWFLLAKGVTLRDLIDFRRLRDEIPEGALTGVVADDQAAIRFAEFYGFVPTGESVDYAGRVLKIYRRA